jgi:hypothetical protein
VEVGVGRGALVGDAVGWNGKGVALGSGVCTSAGVTGALWLGVAVRSMPTSKALQAVVDSGMMSTASMAIHKR